MLPVSFPVVEMSRDRQGYHLQYPASPPPAMPVADYVIHQPCLSGNVVVDDCSAGVLSGDAFTEDFMSNFGGMQTNGNSGPLNDAGIPLWNNGSSLEAKLVSAQEHLTSGSSRTPEWDTSVYKQSPVTSFDVNPHEVNSHHNNWHSTAAMTLLASEVSMLHHYEHGHADAIRLDTPIHGQYVHDGLDEGRAPVDPYSFITDAEANSTTHYTHDSSTIHICARTNSDQDPFMRMFDVQISRVDSWSALNPRNGQNPMVPASPMETSLITDAAMSSLSSTNISGACDEYSVPEINPATSRTTFDNEVNNGLSEFQYNVWGEMPHLTSDGELHVRSRALSAPGQRTTSLSVPLRESSFSRDSTPGSSTSQISVTSSRRSITSASQPLVLSCNEQGCSAIFQGDYRQGNLARHKRRQHRGSPGDYLCKDPSCLRAFNRSDARLKHYRSHHPYLAPKPLERRPNQRRHSQRRNRSTFPEVAKAVRKSESR